MTRIEIDPQSLRRTARVIKDVGLTYLSVLGELKNLQADFPQMSPTYSAVIRPQLETVLERLARLVLFHDPDIAAMRMAARIIERDQEQPWGQSLRVPVDVLNAAYSIVSDVYETARRYGMSLDEALGYMESGNVARELVRLLGKEGTLTPAMMRSLTGIAGIGLDFLEEWARGDGSLWEGTQRTLISSGSAAVAGARVAQMCARYWSHPLVKGGCLLGGGILGEMAGDALSRRIFDEGKLTPEERRTRRAISTPSGITSAEQRQRIEDAREGFEQARRDVIGSLVEQGEDLSEAERIADLMFPDYLLEISYQ